MVDRHNRHIRLYDEVLSILVKLNEMNIPVALASRTDQPTWANQLTKLLQIDPFVQYREIYPGSKINHLRQLKKDAGVPFSKITFFDDEYRNIIDAQTLGVHAVLVSSGLNPHVFTQTTGIELGGVART